MELIVGFLVFALIGIYYFKSKAEKEALDARMEAIKSKDAALKEDQDMVEKAIKDIDAGISALKKERESANQTKDISLEERAKLAKKRYDN